jgi:DNA-binding MarR family transcriptional regulator
LGSPRKRDELQKKILLVMLASEESTKRMLRSSGQTGQLNPLAYSMQIKAIIIKLALMAEMWGCKAADELILKYAARRNAVERAVRQLCRKGLVACHRSRFRGKVRVSYTLTGEGELLAKKLRFEEKVEGLKREGKLEEELKGQLETALKSLRQRLSEEQKPFLATPNDVLGALWQTHKTWYEEELNIFNEFWNKRKLGKMMAKLGYRLTTRKEVEGKRTWAYDLRQSDDVFDMTAALAYLRKAMHLSHVDYWCVLAALWLTTGKQKYPSKEALMAYWTRERVGRVIKSMGFETERKTWRKETLRVYNIASILKWQLPIEISEIIVEAPRRPDPYVDTRYEFLTAEKRAKGRSVEKQEVKGESAPEKLEEKTADSQSSVLVQR